jgi:hypothetical protein
VSNSYGLKVISTENKARVIVLKNAIWGVDDQNRVRFQLFTDGTLHLFNANYQDPITLDGMNGQILIRGQRVGPPARRGAQTERRATASAEPSPRQHWCREIRVIAGSSCASVVRPPDCPYFVTLNGEFVIMPMTVP